MIGPPAPPPGPLAWGAPAQLAQNAPGLSPQPVAVIGATGAATVFWSQTGLVPPGGMAPSAIPLVAAAENTGSTGAAPWSAAVAIEAPPAGAAATDQLLELQARGPATGAAAAWRRSAAGVADTVTAARRTATGWTVAPAATIGAPSTAEGVAFAANDAGVQAVAWVQPMSSPGLPRVLLAVRNVAVGDNWSAPLAVQSASSGDSPRVAVSANGRVMVVWRQQGTGFVHFIRSRTYDSGSGVFGAELGLDDTTPRDTRNPQLVALAGEQFGLVWERQNLAGGFDLMGRTFTGTDWMPMQPQLVAAGTPASVQDARLAAMPGQQVAFAAWRQGTSIHLSRQANLLWSTTPLTLNAALAGSGLQPQLAVDAAGNALVVWAQQPSGGSVRDLYYAQYNGVSANVSSPALLAAGALAGSATPTLAVGANGSAVVAWPQAVAGQPNPDLLARIYRP